MAFAIDHRAQFEAMAEELDVPRERIAPFKVLAVEATARVAKGRPGFGMLIDGTFGREALFRAADHPVLDRPPRRGAGVRARSISKAAAALRQSSWNGRWGTRSRPCASTGRTIRPRCASARSGSCCGCTTPRAASGASSSWRSSASKHGAMAPDTVARVLERLYDLGIKPDWWKLEPQADAAAWRATAEVIGRRDPLCRGIVLLGLEAPEAELEAAFAVAAREPLVKGFAVGRTLFNEAARQWLKGEMTDEAAIADMASRFQRLVEAWQRAAGLAKAA